MALMPEVIPRLLSRLPGGDITQVLHNWWLAESHLDRLLAQYNLNAQNLKKHKEVAVAYVEYFEGTVLPTQDLPAPQGTRAQRVEELEGYRSSSLLHYDELKTWLCEEERRLKFIETHLAFTLASLHGTPAAAPVADELVADEHKALHALLQEHHKALLQWKEVKQHKAPPSGSKAEELHLIMARYQQHMKATLAAVGVDEHGDLPSLTEQLENAQKINAGLQSLLEDEQHAKVEQMQEMEQLLREVEAKQDETDEVRQSLMERRLQVDQEVRTLHLEALAAREATRHAERVAIQQALELQTAHTTNATLAQINDTLQGQVANLQNDNQSFQTRVTALQDTTSSLSSQIGALAKQAQSAANAANQLGVLRGVAATLQQERDAARTIIIAHQRDKSAMEAQMAAVQADLDRANTRVNGLLEGQEALPAPQEGPVLTGNPQDKPNGLVTDMVNTAVGMSTGSDTEPAGKGQQTQQTAALEATIAELQARLLQAEEKSTLAAEKNKKLRQQMRDAKGLRKEVQHMQANLKKSNQNLDTAPNHPSSSTPPAPQISPASPPKPDADS